MILMWSAPWRSCSRTARRTSVTPSAIAMVKTMAFSVGQPPPRSVRRRGSLCPLVWPMARPAMKSRGPGRYPRSTASRMPQSAPPVSRTVVKPRSSMARMSGAARAVRRVSGTASSARMLTSGRNTWTWQSISPGMSVRPPTSTTVAPDVRIGRGDTSRIREPSTRTATPSWRSALVGSRSFAFLNRVRLIGRLLPGRWPARARAALSAMGVPGRNGRAIVTWRDLARPGVPRGALDSVRRPHGHSAQPPAGRAATPTRGRSRKTGCPGSRVPSRSRCSSGASPGRLPSSACRSTSSRSARTTPRRRSAGPGGSSGSRRSSPC